MYKLLIKLNSFKGRSYIRAKICEKNSEHIKQPSIICNRFILILEKEREKKRLNNTESIVNDI